MHDTPQHTLVLRKLGLPFIRPQARYRLAVENEQEDLRNKRGGDKAATNVNPKKKSAMTFAETAVKCKTRKTTNIELDGVDDVADPIEDFRQILGIVGKDTDIGHVSPGTEDNELDCKAEENTVKNLFSGGRSISMLRYIPDTMILLTTEEGNMRHTNVKSASQSSSPKRFTTNTLAYRRKTTTIVASTAIKMIPMIAGRSRFSIRN